MTLGSFYKSTIGKKVSMALSGVIMVGFVIGHMVGNLKIFAGIDPATGDYKIDDYGRFLRSMGSEMFGNSGVLWVVRAVLIVALLVHAISGIQLARLNRAAKPISGNNIRYRSANAASKTMLYGGLFLLSFIAFHILHFTTGHVHTQGFVEGEVYQNVWNAFQNRGIASVYVVAMGFLGMHLYHGTWSMFQTLGVDTPSWNNGIRNIAKVVSVLMFIGFSAVPASIAMNLLPQPVAHHTEGGRH